MLCSALTLFCMCCQWSKDIVSYEYRTNFEFSMSLLTRSPLRIRAESKSCASCSNVPSKASVNAMVKKIMDRKSAFEQARLQTAQQFGGELSKIARSEIAFAKQVVDEIIPVKLSYDSERMQSSVKRILEELSVLSSVMPFRMEFVGTTESSSVAKENEVVPLVSIKPAEVQCEEDESTEDKPSA